MAKTYETIGWEDLPSLKTPINARNLKHMDDAIKDLYDGGASSADIIISPDEPTTEDWKIWIDSDEVENYGTEVVDNLDGNESNLAPSVRAVKEELNVYSTEEVKIGTYNEEPLYRKLLIVQDLPNKTFKNYSLNIENKNLTTKIYGFIYDETSSNPWCYPLDYNSGTVGRITVLSNKTTIQIETTMNLSTMTGHIIVEYTKTTD